MRPPHTGRDSVRVSTRRNRFLLAFLQKPSPDLLPLDLSLQPHRPALVQPEMLPCLVRNHIAGPGVRDLVRDHVRQRPVAGEQGGRHEGQAAGKYHEEREDLFEKARGAGAIGARIASYDQSDISLKPRTAYQPTNTVYIPTSKHDYIPTVPFPPDDPITTPSWNSATDSYGFSIPPYGKLGGRQRTS